MNTYRQIQAINIEILWRPGGPGENRVTKSSGRILAGTRANTSSLWLVPEIEWVKTSAKRRRRVLSFGCELRS